MKKLAITGMLLSGLTALAGITGLVICDGESVEAAQEQRMVRVEHTAYGDILCDNRTGVAYFAYRHGGRMEAYSGVCVTVDANGKPLVMGE